MLISVVIRTYNEARYLDELLAATRAQESPSCDIEVVLVDSGSTDDTLEIAGRHGCRITHISQQEFFAIADELLVAHESGESPPPRMLYTETELTEIRKLQAIAQAERAEIHKA